MAVQLQLSALEEFLQTVPDDTEDAPWMVMASLQVRDIDLLKAVLLLHRDRLGLPWVIESYLKITMPRPVDGRPLDAAPDLLVAEGVDSLRTSWNIPAEGKAPEFVLEVAASSSWERDSKEKPGIYDGMGVKEYVIFYPQRADGGTALTGFRRDAHGNFVPWNAGAGGVLWSQVLNLGLYVNDDLWLRAVDHQGRNLPTPNEWAEIEAARANAAAARAEAEALRANAATARAEAEAAARAAAEAEAARLRAELQRLREDRGPADDRASL